MSTKNQVEDGQIIFVKGALDVLLDRCDRIANPGSAKSAVRPGSGGESAALASRTLTAQDRRRIVDQNMNWSSQGLRVLAFACKPVQEIPGEKARRRKI